MTIRNDIHKPSVIIPENYEFVAFEYLGSNVDNVDIQIEREQIYEHMKRTGGTYSHHAHGGNCHICGAWCIYSALFYHKITNMYIRTGLICAEKLDSLDTEKFRKSVLNAINAKAGINKAKAILELHELSPAWDLFSAPYSADYRYEENTIRDIVYNIVKYGNLSERQIVFLRTLFDKIEKREADDLIKDAEYAAAEEVSITDDRVHVEGEILTVRNDETNFGLVTKMLIKTAAGYKLWGTYPSALFDCNANRGDRVQFEARIKRSEKDAKFGFFSRPTKSSVLSYGVTS